MASPLLPPGYLHTDGAAIVDAAGRRVRLAGVNWYGCDCTALVVGGLDHQPLEVLCRLIVSLGFNTLRLPFCVELVADNPAVDHFLDAEPSLTGKTALEIMDAVVAAAGRQGLKVVLDSHRGPAGWSTQENGLWYTREYPESAWINSWVQLARRYAGDSTVIGCDLHNEPGSPPPQASAWPGNGGALWAYGDGRFGGSPRDWAAAATHAANRILSVNPDLLILVEGVRYDPAGPPGNNGVYWFGGNLTGMRSGAFPHRLRPARIDLEVPNRLVYSVHDYGPDMYRAIPWCQAGSTAANPDACYSVCDATWGFIVEEGIAPVLVGEFGTPNGRKPGDRTPPQLYTDVNPQNPQGSWFSYLIQYIRDHDLHWTYWALNGTQSQAPGRDARNVEWYGVLDPIWAGVASEPLMRKLESIQTAA